MINCGFFNSIDNDRPYNAEQMNNPYKRLVSNGVFAKPDGEKSDDFKVYTNGGMSVLVSAGDGIFDYKWANNTAPYEIAVPMADLYNDRIDSVIFRVNYVDRVGELILVEGVASDNPIAPELIRNEKYVDYRLANISVKTGVLAISAIDIVDTRATTDCGFVTHLLQQSDITETYSNWQAQFDAWFLNLKETIATTTIISSFSSKFIATENTTEVPINVDNYNSVLDILQVYKDGLLLVENYDYTVNDFNTITLNEEIAADTQIAFIVYKSVDGSEAESFIRDMEELMKRVKVVENSFDTLESNVESKLDNFETRVETAEANVTRVSNDLATTTTRVNTATTNISNLTTKVNKNVSDITALDTRIDALEINNANTALWDGANTLGNGEEIKPSKALSACKNGWLLVFCGYNTSNNLATNTRFNTVFVNKGIHENIPGTRLPLYCNMIANHFESGNVEYVAKSLNVYDDRIEGAVQNTINDLGKSYCLRFVFEF